MDFHSFLSDLIATTAGGVLITFLLFWAKERWFPVPRITGKWEFEMQTTGTTFRPYEGMLLRYAAMIWSEGNRIRGTAEKVYERSANGERTYVGKDRARATVSGLIEKKYFSPDVVVLHLVEQGRDRESTHLFSLTIVSGESMTGKFDSLIADQTGESVWKRGQV